MSTAVVPPRTASRIAALLDRLVCSISRHERLWLCAAFAVFALLLIYSAVSVPLSFDEFFTIFISRLPSLSAMLHAMPADSQPPLQYLLTHLSLQWLGTSELGARLPEMIAYLAASWLAWRIVRVHGTRVQALFALLLMLGASTGRILLSGFSVFGLSFNARPYELTLAFTALAFLCWQTATLYKRNRLLPLTGLACAIAGAILSHHYGFLQIGPALLAGEVIRFRSHRRIDLGVLAAIAAGLLAFPFTIPLALRTRTLLDSAILHNTHFFARPSLLDFICWPAMLPWLLFLPLTLLACLPPSAKTLNSPTPELPAVPRHEMAAAIALALIVPAQILLAAVTTGYFQPRYAVDTTLGLTLLCAWAWPRTGRLRSAAEPILAVLCLGFLLVAAVDLCFAEARHPAGRRQLVQSAVPPLLLNAPEALPIVAADPFLYVPQWWYAPPAIQQRLIFLSDIDYAVQRPAFLAELSVWIDRADLPEPIATYSSFTASHPRFVLLCTGKPRDNWILPRLRESGWHLTVLQQSGADILYQADHP